MYLLPALVAVLFPGIALAATFKDIVDLKIIPLGNAIISLLYGIAFLFFLVGMVQLFFSRNEETRQKGKAFALWGIIALVVLFAVWGLVNILLGVLGSFAA